MVAKKNKTSRKKIVNVIQFAVVANKKLRQFIKFVYKMATILPFSEKPNFCVFSIFMHYLNSTKILSLTSSGNPYLVILSEI